MEWTTISLHHWWWVYFQGRKGHIKARWATFWPLLKFFYENSLRSIQKLLEFEKKVFKKDYPRLAAFKTTFSLGINFLWSYPSELNQIEIMWLFWPKICSHSIILAFKGQEGQERPYNSFQPNSAKQNFIAKSFILKNMHFLFS